MGRPRILIVEDELLIAKNLERKLKKLEYEVIDAVSSSKDAILVSETQKPDLVLMDIVIKGQESGLDAANFIQNNLGIPVIYVTALTDAHTLSQVQEIGGYGFIPKPFQAHQVDAAIQVALGQHRKLQQLQQQATQDSLTGIANRASFLAYADHEIKRSKRYGEPFAVLMIDIDHFKQVNDAFGHAFGDQVLCQMTAIIAQTLRATDHFGRLGGEEFAVFLPHTLSNEAMAIGQRILAEVLEHAMSFNGHKTTITVSIGLACYDDSDADFAAILARADQALYQAKHRGRNRLEFIPANRQCRNSERCTSEPRMAQANNHPLDQESSLSG
ncbi:MAG: diguanylate cyclase [Nodosilinea sp.]